MSASPGRFRKAPPADALMDTGEPSLQNLQDEKGVRCKALPRRGREVEGAGYSNSAITLKLRAESANHPLFGQYLRFALSTH